MDELFNAKMQIFGLVDTMWDIISDSLGTVLSMIIIYRFLRNKKENFIIITLFKFINVNIESNSLEQLENVNKY